MAIIECKECGGKVSDSAAACPHCGAPVAVAAVSAAPEEATKKGGRWKWVLAWIFGVPVGLFVLLMAIGMLSGNSSKYTDYKTPVRELLKDGGSAQFSDVTRYSNGSVCGMVNAKNSFGGYVGSRRFVVAPTGRAMIDDGTSVGSKVFDGVMNNFCTGSRL